MEFQNSIGEVGTYTSSTTKVALSGTPVQGHQAFDDAPATNGETFLCKIVDSSGNWKLGVMTYASATPDLTLSGSWLASLGTLSETASDVQVFNVSHYALTDGLHFDTYNEGTVFNATAGATPGVVLDGRTYRLTLSANATVALSCPSGAASGTAYSALIIFVQGASAYTVSWSGGTNRLFLGTQTDSTTNGDYFAYLVTTVDAGTNYLIMPAGTE